MLKRLIVFVQLGRPHFLLGGLLFYGLGVVMALYDGIQLHLAALIWGQIAVTVTQLMTHYANDAFDIEADRANRTPTNWSGGSRILVEGALSARTALIAAVILAILALVANSMLSIWLVPSTTTFALLLTAELLAWFYSAPPLRLHSQGIGELTASLIVAVLTPLSGYYLQTERIAANSLLSLMPLAFLQFAMLISIEFPDREGDEQADKRTLTVRLGAATTARLYILVLILTYAMLPILVFAGLPLAVAIAVISCSPLALMQLIRIQRGDWQNTNRWNHLGFYTIVLLMATVFAEVIAFLYLISQS